MTDEIKVTKRPVEIGSTGAFTNVFFLLNDNYIVWADKDVRGNERWRWARQIRSPGRFGFSTHGARDTFKKAVACAVDNSQRWKEIEP